MVLLNKKISINLKKCWSFETSFLFFIVADESLLQKQTKKH